MIIWCLIQQSADQYQQLIDSSPDLFGYLFDVGFFEAKRNWQVTYRAVHSNTHRFTDTQINSVHVSSCRPVVELFVEHGAWFDLIERVHLHGKFDHLLLLAIENKQFYMAKYLLERAPHFALAVSDEDITEHAPHFDLAASDKIVAEGAPPRYMVFPNDVVVIDWDVFYTECRSVRTSVKNNIYQLILTFTNMPQDVVPLVISWL